MARSKRGGEAMHAPCRSYPGCHHAKHGYTRKDREPRIKPAYKRGPARYFDRAGGSGSGPVLADEVLPEEVTGEPEAEERSRRPRGGQARRQPAGGRRRGGARGRAGGAARGGGAPAAS